MDSHKGRETSIFVNVSLICITWKDTNISILSTLSPESPNFNYTNLKKNIRFSLITCKKWSSNTWSEENDLDLKLSTYGEIQTSIERTPTSYAQLVENRLNFDNIFGRNSRHDSKKWEANTYFLA